MLPLALACTPDSSDAGKDSLSPKPTEPTSASSAQPSVAQPPELDKTETLAASQHETQGSRSIEFDKGKQGDALIVAVRCQGRGTIKVTVKPVNVGFPLECGDGEVTTTYNQVGVKGVENKGTVSVQAPSAVRWSMTVGRGEAAAPEPPESPEAQ
ncbi:hypothetical protein ACFUNF_38415 [Streptomyces sp. NPDC057291]|uniref:hypothetical protein n=1 Tax=Streptomyces sp. NPDC057291 TaxID=3346087 RepID=UPI003645AA73